MRFLSTASFSRRKSIAGHRVVDDLLLHRHRQLRHLLAVGAGPLLVAEHRDSLRGEPPGQVAEGLHGAHGLVLVVRTGSVDEHHRRERSLPRRKAQRPQQDPGRVAQPHVDVAELLGVDVGRRDPVRGQREGRGQGGGREADGGELSERVEDEQRAPLVPLQLQRNHDARLLGGRLHLRVAHRPEPSVPVLDAVPPLPEAPGGEDGDERGREPQGHAVRVPLEEESPDLVAPLDEGFCGGRRAGRLDVGRAPGPDDGMRERRRRTVIAPAPWEGPPASPGFPARAGATRGARRQGR